MKKLKTFYESIHFFKNSSLKKNEYCLKKNVIKKFYDSSIFDNVKKVHILGFNTFFNENLVLSRSKYNNVNARLVLQSEAIDRFHPNNINNKDFWITCRKQFPKLSVCGRECKTIKEANKFTLDISKETGLLDFIKELIKNSKEKPYFFEIGFGYGNIFYELKDITNYYGIDYIIPKNLKKYRNFISINKTGIPDFFIDTEMFDIIYSINVLQHCSQKDRFDYIRQSYSLLKNGGYLIFSLSLMTSENKNLPYWGFIDKSGRGYTNFFNQLTECDYDYELKSLLDEIGFNVIDVKEMMNFYTFIVQK